MVIVNSGPLSIEAWFHFFQFSHGYFGRVGIIRQIGTAGQNTTMKTECGFSFNSFFYLVSLRVLVIPHICFLSYRALTKTQIILTLSLSYSLPPLFLFLFFPTTALLHPTHPYSSLDLDSFLLTTVNHLNRSDHSITNNKPISTNSAHKPHPQLQGS